MQNNQRDHRRRQGRLAIVSLGPGFDRYMVPKALEALRMSEVVVGYRTYLALISEIIAGKEIHAGAMRKEVDRCELAIDLATEGRRVALVSSGDAGIYGMAGLVFDLCRERKLRVSAEPGRGDDEPNLIIEIIPGVAAFNAAASLLGAPLMHDFASVSLSDHLTPWEMIEKRLHLAAQADFVIAIYNPRSKARPRLLENALRILLRHRPPATPVGIVWKAMRDGQRRMITTLGSVPVAEIDMQTMIIVGNSQSYAWEDWMVTPRGYLDKYRF